MLGSGVALELERRGQPVTLVDQDERAMNRASLRNEGKIHLGLIYANDPSLATARLQLDGALRFRGIVSRWLGDAAGWLSLSTPFLYMVAWDSLLDPGRLAAHYAAIAEHCRERFSAEAALDYLGERPAWIARRADLARLHDRLDTSRFQAAFETTERALDPALLASAIRGALAARPAITFLPSHRTRAIARRDGGWTVEGDAPGGAWSIEAAQVVNATWERRLGFDQQLGIAPPADLLHRLKYRIIARVPEALRGGPSVTMVLGRYGDVVIRPDGTAYLSWYPAGLRGWSSDAEPPRDWDPACRGDVPEGEAREIAAGILAGIDAWYPGIGRCEPLLVDAGAIVAVGRTDVDDAASGLHDRTRIGVHTLEGYHSVDPGKLTTAPRFALEVAERAARFSSAGRS